MGHVMFAQRLVCRARATHASEECIVRMRVPGEGEIEKGKGEQERVKERERKRGREMARVIHELRAFSHCATPRIAGGVLARERGGDATRVFKRR